MPPPPRAPYRRRRVLWTLLLITFVALFQLYKHPDALGSWSLPSYLKDLGSSSSPARVVADAKIGESRLAVQEIHGLLHFVTAYPDRTLDEAGGDIEVLGLGKVHVDPQQRVDYRVYAPDGDDLWQGHVRKLQTDTPLVVFSKSYCPYSKRAKLLLQSYRLEPPPFVVELDLRSDGPIIQAILKRLTGRTTVPNVILHGESLGGSDDVHQLHEDDKLKALLEEGGLRVAGV